MLTNVPKAVSHAVRQVTLRHPNSMDCSVWRKRVTRIEVLPGSGLPSESMGMPTMGGMGVLKSEDEAEIDYVDLGDAKILLCGIWQPAEVNERDNALLQPNAVEAQVEPLVPPTDSAYFTPDTGDMVMLNIGFGVVIAYSIEVVMGGVNIPPYTRKYIMNPRDDLHRLPPFED